MRKQTYEHALKHVFYYVCVYAHTYRSCPPPPPILGTSLWIWVVPVDEQRPRHSSGRNLCKPLGFSIDNCCKVFAAYKRPRVRETAREGDTQREGQIQKRRQRREKHRHRPIQQHEDVQKRRDYLSTYRVERDTAEWIGGEE
jgi:hypothetical protein